jgi:hypothetical protein
MLSIHRLRRCWRLSTPRTERTYTWTSCEPNVWLQGPADHPGRPSQRHSPDSLGVWHAVSCVPDPALSDSCITNVHVSPTPCATLGRPWNVRGMTRARKAKHMHAGLRQSSCRAKRAPRRPGPSFAARNGKGGKGCCLPASCVDTRPAGAGAGPNPNATRCHCILHEKVLTRVWWFGFGVEVAQTKLSYTNEVDSPYSC